MNIENNVVKNEKNQSIIVRCLITSGFLLLYCVAFGGFSLLFMHNEQMAGILKLIIGIVFMIPLTGLVLGEGAKLAKSEFSRLNRGDTTKFMPKKVPYYVPLLTMLPLVGLTLIFCVLGVCLGQKFIFFQTVALHLASPISLIFLGLGIVKISIVSSLSLIPIVGFVATITIIFLVSFNKEQNRLIENHKKIANEIKFNSRLSNR